MPTERQQLDRCEKRIKEQVAGGIVLLGELQHTQDNFEQIGRLLETPFLSFRQKRCALDKPLREVKSCWPLTFALYLVLEGIYNYKTEEKFWHGPRKRLGLGDVDTSDCGKLFLKIVAQSDLPTFENVRGHRYVTPILLHGGIPTNCLDSFFDFIQQQSDSHEIAVDARSLLDLWRQFPDEYLGYVQKPVRRFIRYGGAIAEDFLARCLELTSLSEPKEAAELDLPERIVHAYWQWRENNPQRPRKTKEQIRLTRPALSLAPYGEGIYFSLPDQFFPTNLEPRELDWHIELGNDDTQRITTLRQRVPGGYNYHVPEIVSVGVAVRYNVTLLRDGTTLNRWTLASLDDPPLLVFDPFDDYSADALDEEESRRPGRRWLVYPSYCTLAIIGGESRLIRPLPRLVSGHQIEEWELAPGEISVTGSDGHTYQPFHVIHETSRRRSYLTGGVKVLTATAGQDFPLYSGAPPQLAISLNPNFSIQQQLARWRISLYPEGKPYRSCQLAKLDGWTTKQEDGTVLLDLSARELLGPQPKGKFEIRVRGPLGRGNLLRLQIVPHLSIAGQEQLYLSALEGPAEFRITCESQAQLQIKGPREDVQLTYISTALGMATYGLQVEPAVPQVQMVISYEGEDAVQTPFQLPIQRLRWGLWEPSLSQQLSWQVQPMHIYTGEVSHEAEVRVSLPLFAGGPELYCGWRLLDANDTEQRLSSPNRRQLRQHHHIPWVEFAAACRESDNTLRLQLLVWRSDTGKEEAIDAMYLSPTLNLGTIACDWEEIGGKIHLNLLWEVPQRGGRRQVRLWPQDRPWVKKPLVLTMTDGDKSSAHWALSTSDLPAGRYLGEAIVYNPWNTTPAQRPELGLPNTFILESPNLADHYAYLTTLRDTHQATAEQLLNLLCYQHRTGQQNEVYQTNKRLYDLRSTLTLAELTRWANLVRDLVPNAYNAYKLAQFGLFNKEVVGRLSVSAPDPMLLEQYFSHLTANLDRGLYFWVVKSSLRQKRQQCLQWLCQLSTGFSEKEYPEFGSVIKAILDDVATDNMRIKDGAELLLPVAQVAAAHLAEIGSQDAADILQLLTQEAGLSPKWVWTGMRLSASVGPIEIQRLRGKKDNTRRHCAVLPSPIYAEISLHFESNPLAARLDLSNSLVHFEKIKPYKCSFCGHVYRNRSICERHYSELHPHKEVKVRREKADLKITIEWERDYE